jgi:hypothetical protein
LNNNYSPWSKAPALENQKASALEIPKKSSLNNNNNNNTF